MTIILREGAAGATAARPRALNSGGIASVGKQMTEMLKGVREGIVLALLRKRSA